MKDFLTFITTLKKKKKVKTGNNRSDNHNYLTVDDLTPIREQMQHMIENFGVWSALSTKALAGPASGRLAEGLRLGVF